MANLNENNYMGVGGAAPVISYVRTDTILTRDDVPKSWLPPKMQMVPLVEKKTIVHPSPGPVKLDLQDAIDIKSDVQSCLVQEPLGSLGSLPPLPPYVAQWSAQLPLPPPPLTFLPPTFMPPPPPQLPPSFSTVLGSLDLSGISPFVHNANQASSGVTPLLHPTS